MLKKEDAPRIKKFIATLMRGADSVKDMVQTTKDIEWLAKMALDLEKPDIKVVKTKHLDKSEKKVKVKNRGS